MRYEFKQREYVILQRKGQVHTKQSKQHAEYHRDYGRVNHISSKQTK